MNGKCKVCGKGGYQYGTALYAYFSCGHAYAKPIGQPGDPWYMPGKWGNAPKRRFCDEIWNGE